MRRFLGHTEPTRVFLVATGGTDVDYADLKASYCAFIGDSRTQCMGDLLATVSPPLRPRCGGACCSTSWARAS